MFGKDSADNKKGAAIARNSFIFSTGDGNRTRTGVSAHRILSPAINGFIWFDMYYYVLIDS